MGKAHSNGKNGTRPKVKLSHPSGLPVPMSGERYFDMVATVRITGYGDPLKEQHKYIATLRHIVDTAFPNAEVDSEVYLP